MSKIKSILIALMCLVVCLAFAACGNTSEGDSASGSANESTSISTSEPSESDSLEPSSETVSVCSHNFVLKSETAPDCEHAGKKVLKCEKCGEEKTEAGEPALGHLFGEWEVINAETCTVDGEKARYCTRDNCDGMETAKIPAAHKYALNSEASVAPTCEAVGKDVYECSVCHDKYDEVIPALGHEENTDIARVVTKATCEGIGYTTLTCKRCGEIYNIEEVEALGHDYVAGATESATCAYAGYTVISCSRCDKSYRDVTAEKLGHSFGDDGICTLCGKSYLEANALFVSSEDNKAYAVKDEAYDYLIYAKDDTSYETTVTIDREIVDRLIANRYFKINFMLGNPDKCYRAMGYKLPGDENFRYVNIFQENGFGDNTKFELVIGNENGADEAVVTDKGIVITFLYRYNGADNVVTDKEPEEKYHGTLDRFALKMEYVYTPKPFDYEDKTTWLTTDYKVTYLGELSWKMNGAKYGDEKNVTIQAEVINALIAHGYESFMFALSFEEGEKVIYYVDGVTQGNIVNYVSDSILLDENAAANGLTYRILYSDINHTNPAWGGTKDVDGFTFTLTLNKKFNLDDKETWTKSVYSIAYDETNARFEVTDGDPGTEQIEQDITLTPELLSAMKAQKMGSFIITMKCKPNQLSILGMKTSAWQYGAPGADITGAEIVITDDMLQNGYTFRGLYADKAQRDNLTGYDQSNGFYFTIEFIKEVDYTNKANWTKSAYTIIYDEVNARFSVTDGDPGTKEIQHNITFVGGLFNEMKNQGYISFVITMMRKDNQFTILGFHNGAWQYANPGQADPTSGTVEITDAIIANGYTFMGLYADLNQRWMAEGQADNGSDQADGFYFTIEFSK